MHNTTVTLVAPESIVSFDQLLIAGISRILLKVVVANDKLWSRSGNGINNPAKEEVFLRP